MRHPRPRWQSATAVLAVAAALAVPAGRTAWGDDTVLFKTQVGKPYVYIVLDASSSMNLAPPCSQSNLNAGKCSRLCVPKTGTNGCYVPASGDDSGSKFQQVKQALFQVFNEIYLTNGDVVHMGFATFNQDNLRVRGKHWLYKVTSISSPLSIGYPIVGNVLTFGKHFSLGAGTTDGVAGGCGLSGQPAALPLSTTPSATADDVLKLDRFSKLEPSDQNGDGLADTYATTSLWVTISSGANKGTYRIDVSQVAGSGDFRPNSTFQAKFSLWKLNSNAANCTAVTAQGTATATLSYVTEFLLADDNAADGTFAKAITAQCSGNEKDESTDSVTSKSTLGWNWQDAQAVNTCGGSKPFSGAGWESNYDSSPWPADPTLSGQTDIDPYNCVSTPQHTCGTNPDYDLKYATTAGAQRVLDKGDMIPFHWNPTYHTDFFRRLAPNYFNGAALSDLEFRAAPYFRDAPDANGVLHLRDDDLRPLIPYGASPLGGAVTDFRCWYLGSDDPKCKTSLQPYGSGWDDLAKQFDQDFGCRKPYLIVVGDGESHGNNNDPTSAVANLKKNLVQTWAVDYGGDCSPSGTYHSLTQAGNGTCVAPQTQDDLITALRNIVGQIIEATKSFSSAAVPTVQADVADRIFLSNFTPLSDAVAPVWIGHMNGFLKPLPTTPDGKPDTSATALCPDLFKMPVSCTSADLGHRGPCPVNSTCTNTAIGPQCVATGCFLWDAGAQMLNQVQPIATQIGTGAQQRRIYYSGASTSGQWATTRHYFNQRVYGTDTPSLRFDFWRGLGLSFITPELSAATNLTTQTTANTVVASTMAKKSADLNNPHTATTADDTPFVLGDIFHSSPVVVGSPVNTIYFANNVTGYRDFFTKHQNRRKVLLVGANDGMLHAFDAGLLDASRQLFNNGTGSEIFGFVPRTVMPTLTGFFANGQNRTWTVDGNITVGDVRIDPVYSGGVPDADVASSNPDLVTNGPEWRTVAIGGLREGGVGYYALDITQPDTLADVTAGTPPVTTKNVPQPLNGYVPSCSGGDNGLGGKTGCGPVPYPVQLWAFRDGINIPDPTNGGVAKVVQLDEDGNGVADLAPGWSTPNIGRIRVIDSGKTVDKYVAIFGGGLDTSEQAGNWLYMVDIETGQTIYKQPLVGSAPSEPSAIDIDGDGYLDRIYIGTTQGFLYRVDLQRADGTLPTLVPFTSSVTYQSATYTLAGKRITDADFSPRIVFKAQPDGTTPAASPRPIYYRAAVIFIANLNNQFAIAFGTGDRNDLFSHDFQPGRFYVFRDDIAVGNRTTFYTEANLQAINVTDAPLTQDLLTNPNATKQGWFLSLNTDERLITNPFALSGIIIFTGFTPDPPPTTGGTCKRTGTSRIFAVTATNASGLLFDSYGTASRYTQIADFVTDPYTEQGLTKNPVLSTSRPNADQFPTGSHLADVLKQLQTLFPPNCKFGNYRIDVKTLSSDTGVIFIAPVPVCIIEKNWKEF
jgi:hypothetical protein